jgi:hypothetical protein
MLGAQLILVALFAYLGYREAAKFEREHGRGPFGAPPWAWAVITGFSLIIGAVLLAIARRQAKNAPVHAWVAPSAPVAPPAAFGASYDRTASPAAPPREDLWAAPASGPTPAAAPAIVPVVPTQQPAPAPFAPAAASRDILPGR